MIYHPKSQLSVYKMLTNIKKIKLQSVILLQIDFDKTNIEAFSSDVIFIILFILRESRGYPTSFVIKGLEVDDYDFTLDASDLGHPRLSFN